MNQTEQVLKTKTDFSAAPDQFLMFERENKDGSISLIYGSSFGAADQRLVDYRHFPDGHLEYFVEVP